MAQTRTRQRKVGSQGPGPRKANQPRNNAASDPAQQKPIQSEKESSDAGISTNTQDDNAEICWICAEPVKYYSVSECNHRTCHICALRLRALYKKLDCTFCKESQSSVIFTKSADATFSSFTPDSIPYKDPKLSIFFETEEMMEETLILLRFNCPVADCDYVSGGWSDLKLHVRGIHGKLMCDLCIRTKKVFAHEHVIYHPNTLPLHLPSFTGRGSKILPNEKVEGGVHPMCEFCRECFFGDDELYAHMREKHEDCFICKRNDIMHQYFNDYDALETHFMRDHHPCKQPYCLAQKFVVFGTVMDLQAHTVEEHGAEMTPRDRKDARRIEAEFEFEDITGGRRRREGNHNRDRDREPPPVRSSQDTSRQPVNARRRGFGANLTSDTPSSQGTSSFTQIGPISPFSTETESATAEYAAFLSRLRSLAPNSPGAVNSVQLALRSYRASESAARDLILTVWNIIDQNLDGTASLINALVDILDEEEKKIDLLSAWNGFKIEQRNQFPELVPTAIGSDYAGIAGGRLLNAKLSTTTRSSLQSSRQVLDRVAQAAASSSRPQKPPERFPALPTVATPVSYPKPPAFRQTPRTTPWSSTASAASSSHAPSSVPNRPDSSGSSKPLPSLSKTAFPELPQSSTTRVPKNFVNGNPSLRNILGDPASQGSAWGAGGSPRAIQQKPSDTDTGTPAGKSKKGKGKQKQTLFTLGSFPT